MSQDNELLIRQFYAAFSRRDADGMAACYAADVSFSDPVFRDLRGDQARAMWAMLCARATSLAVTLVEAHADGDRGQARWEAVYPFSQTGRTVRNVIDARFVFANGRIVEHRDRFSLWRWAGMALGAKGWLFGWLPPVRAKIRRQAMASLAAWQRG